MFCCGASGAARDAERDAAARTRTLRGLTDRRAHHTSVQLHGRTLTLEQSPCAAHTVAILATEERGTHRLLHAALRRAFRRVDFVRRSTVRRCLARAEVDTAPTDWVAVAVCRGVR